MYLYCCWFGSYKPYDGDSFDSLLRLEEVYCDSLMFDYEFNYNIEYKFKIIKK